MNFLSIAQNRYTTKMHNGKRIPEDTLNQLKEILRLSPSSINSQPWQFIFVGDERKNEVFAPLSLINQERVKLASHIVIFRVLESVARFEQEAPSYISEGGFAFYKQYIKSQGDASCGGLDGTPSICGLGLLPLRLCHYGNRLYSYGGYPSCRVRQAPTQGRLSHPLCCGYWLPRP